MRSVDRIMYIRYIRMFVKYTEWENLAANS